MKTPYQLNPELCFVNDKEELLFSVEVVLSGLHTVESAVNTIQDVHFNELGGSGYFRLLSPHAKHCTPDYVFEGDDNIVYSVEQQEHTDTTIVKLLLVRIEYESLQEEYDALYHEFDYFAESDVCVSWKQLPLNLPAEHKTVTVHFSQNNEQVHMVEMRFKDANLLSMAQSLNELTNVDKTEPVDYLILKQNSETVFAQGSIELGEIL